MDLALSCGIVPLDRFDLLGHDMEVRNPSCKELARRIIRTEGWMRIKRRKGAGKNILMIHGLTKEALKEKILDGLKQRKDQTDEEFQNELNELNYLIEYYWKFKRPIINKFLYFDLPPAQRAVRDAEVLMFFYGMENVCALPSLSPYYPHYINSADFKRLFKKRVESIYAEDDFANNSPSDGLELSAEAKARQELLLHENILTVKKSSSRMNGLYETASDSYIIINQGNLILNYSEDVERRLFDACNSFTLRKVTEMQNGVECEKYVSRLKGTIVLCEGKSIDQLFCPKNSRKNEKNIERVENLKASYGSKPIYAIPISPLGQKIVADILSKELWEERILAELFTPDQLHSIHALSDAEYESDDGNIYYHWCFFAPDIIKIKTAISYINSFEYTHTEGFRFCFHCLPEQEDFLQKLLFTNTPDSLHNKITIIPREIQL